MKKPTVFGSYLEDPNKRRLKLSGALAEHERWSETIMPADHEAQSPETEISRRPLAAFGAVLVFAFVILTVRLFVLQIVDGSHNLALADGNRIHLELDRAPRGIIYDRHDQPLVRNQASFDVVAVPAQLPHGVDARQALYAQVASITQSAATDIASNVEATCKTAPGPACLSSTLPVLAVHGISRDQALLLEQASASLPGFSLDVNPIREYMDQSMLSSILGYTGRISAADVQANPNLSSTDYIGKLGLELQYQDVLSGQSGGQQIEVDALGRPVKVLATKPSIAGNNLILNIDAGLETHLRDAIQKQMDASGAKRGSGVIVDPKTGDVLAVVSLPSYDNNLFSRGISQVDYSKLTADPGQPLFNKAISGEYPSGSIIKPLGATAALQEGIVTTSTIINDTGQISIPNQFDPTKPPAIFHGWERNTGLGAMNVISALAQSSDIYFYEMAGGLVGQFTHYLGVDKLTRYYQKFGLGAKTGIDLPSEGQGRVPTPAWKKQYSGEDWYTGDTYNISVGQGDILVSPLQMVMAIAAIANGGTLYQPQLVHQITDSNGTVLETMAPVVTRSSIASAANLALVRQGMRQAVIDPKGTACCKIEKEVPVAVAGKTGTAETVGHDSGAQSGQSLPEAWFEAFAPYDDPQVAIVVMIEHAGEGAQYAVPAARETLAWYFSQANPNKP